MKHIPLQKNNNGFTLIELLVVIAIIGILVALVLAGVTSSREKATDRRIQSSIRQLRVIAEGAFDDAGASYVGWPTFQPTEVNTLVADIEEAVGQTGVVVLRDNQTQHFCISAPMSTKSDRYFCADAKGGPVIVDSICPEDPFDEGEPVLECPPAVE
jgi:prepilin-type N-terminal cleavage/methylation domain-containing protein